MCNHHQEVCQECDPQCKSCGGRGIKEDICECLNFKQDNECVASCQAGFYGDKQKDCQACHRECKTCVGPWLSNCTVCKNYKIYWDDLELYRNKTNANYSDGKSIFWDGLDDRRRWSLHHSRPVSNKAPNNNNR